ncbi:ribosome biogenesis GTP-binding protein YihA/YsxC [Lentisalinibacter orientalis]|uniref:ribosome biogenesis GTP-binding protein YihA/YsxC n=1 Tax=Lentisalinibacter orientalis TaxID=2992241 RepID=UPI00386C75FB
MSQYPAARFLASAHNPSQFLPDSGREVAFAGRSNAGKSSAINTIVNRRQFAHTSKTPGRTQLVNFFELWEEARLVDLPGYGFARVSASMQRHWRGLMSAYFAGRRSLTGLFLIVDIRRRLTDFDWQMLDLAEGIEVPVHVLLTKADKLKRGQAASELAKVRKELDGAATAQLFSALKREGVAEARQRLEAMLARSPEAVEGAQPEPEAP